VDCYLIAKDLGSLDELGAWEVRIETDPNVFFIGTEIFGDNINVGIHPEFQVGLGSPFVPDNGLIILAKFSLFSTGSGKAYLKPLLNPSIPGSSSPIYFRNSDSALFEFEVLEISTGGAVCEFNNTCAAPIFSEDLTLDNYSIEGAKAVAVLEGTALEVGKRHPQLEYELALYKSDVVFKGMVVEVKYQCMELPGGSIQSLAFIEFEVIDKFWGVSGNRIVVDTRVNRPNNCIEYKNRDLFENFMAGEVYMVLCSRNGLRNEVKQIYKETGKAFVGPSGSKASLDIVKKSQSYKERRDFSAQIRVADFVGLVEVSEESYGLPERPYVLNVIESYFGGLEAESLIVKYKSNKNPDLGPIIMGPVMNVGQQYLVILTFNEGEYEFVDGYTSSMLLMENMLYGTRGSNQWKWGPLGLAKSIIRRIK